MCTTAHTCDSFNFLFQTQFVADEVSGIVKETIEQVIGGQTYCNTKVSQWTSSVVEGCLLGLTGLQKPFKYIGEHEVDQDFSFYCGIVKY